MATFTGTAGIDTFNGADATNLYRFDVANLAGTDTVTGNSAPSATDTLEFTTGGTVASAQFAGLTNIEILLLNAAGNDVTVSAGLASQGNATFQILGQGIGADTVNAAAATAGLIINGGGGADNLTGGSGNDSISGGADNDTIAGGGGADTIAGGGGVDTADYSGSSSGVNVTVNGSGTGGDAQGDTLTGIENITGSNFADSLVGDAGNNILNGLGGNDEIIAGAGADTLIGGDGDDYLVGQAGADNIQGGAGNDTISLRASNAAVNVNLATGDGLGGDAQGDEYSGIENVLGSISFDDTITGDANNNQLFGYGGNDTLSGGAGNDFIRGGTGTDTVSGGDGDDIIRADSADIVDGGTGYDSLTPEFGGQTINLNSISGNIDNIEVVDLRGGATSSLITNAASVAAVTDADDELVIFGNSTNNVDVGGGWVLDPGSYTRPDPLNGSPVEMVRYVQADGSAEVFIQASAGNPTVNLTVGLATGPVVDVNGADVNADFAISYTTGTGEAPAVANDATVIEVEGDDITELTITLTSAGSLAAGEGVSLTAIGDGLVSGAGLVISGEGTDTMTISGAAAASVYQDIVREVTYNNPDQAINADLSDRTITFVATDDTTVTSPPVTTTVTLELGNTAPLLIPEVQVSTNEDVAVTASAPKALDLDGDSVTYSVVTGPANGSLGAGVDPVTGAFTYTPNLNFNGQDSFVVEVTDSGGATAQTTITLTVDPVNDQPVITGFATTGTPTEDTSTLFTLSATDADTDPTTILAAVAANGSTVISSSMVTYTPKANFNGMETITVVVSDGNGGTAVQSFTFNVDAVNDLPTVANLQVSTGEDSPINGQLPTPSDVDGDSVTFVAASGTTTAGGSFVVNANGTYTYTPDANYSGTDSFTFQVFDGTANSAVATVNITVNPINDAPIAVDDVATVAEDSSANLINVLVNDSDPDGPAPTIAAAITANGTVTIIGNQLSYTPNANFSGSDTIHYVITDGNGGSDVATVSVTVTPDDDAPVVANATVTTNEDKPISGVLPAISDADTPNPSFVANSTTDANGTFVVNANGTYSFTPVANVNGTVSYNFDVTDTTTTTTATLTIQINAINDNPVANNFAAAAMEGGPVVVIDVGPQVSDVDVGDTPMVTTAVAQHGSVAFLGQTINYTPDADFAGNDTITYVVSDGNGGTAVASITVAVSGANDDPTVAGLSTSGVEDQVLTGQLPAPVDPDGDAVTFVAVTGLATAHGTVDITTGGQFTYTPNANYHGPDSFTFTVDDGNSGTATATVTLDIASVNDAPVATSGLTATADEDGGTVTISLTPPGTDVDSGDVVALTQAIAANGTVSVSGNDILYTPFPGFAGSDTITFLVSDGNGGFDSETIAVTVNPINDAPVFPLPGLHFSTNEDTAFSSFVVPAFDADGDTLTYSIEASGEAANGTAVITDPLTGAFTYTPDPDTNGPDSFTVTVSDGSLSSTITVFITVDPENDAPTIATVAPQTTDENTPLVLNLVLDDPDTDAVSISSAVAQSGTVAITGTGQITYTPTQELAEGDSASDTITVVVSDGNGGFASQDIAVTVEGVNDDPTAANGSANGTEGTDVVIDVASLISDVDGDMLSITSATSLDGTVGIVGTVLTFTPMVAGFNGLTTIEYTVDDGNSGTATGTLTVAIAPENGAPEITVPASFAATEDVATAIGGVSISDSDLSGDITVIVEATNGRVNITGVGSAVVDANTQLVEKVTITGTLADVNATLAVIGFVPNEDYDGPATVQIIASDGSAVSVETIPISVASVNDKPEAISQEPITLDEGGTAVVSLTNIFAEDADDAPLNLSVRIDSLPTAGTLLIGGVPVLAVPATFTALQLASGQVTYSADDGEPSGVLSFTVTVLDDETPTPAESDPLTVSIVVNAVNDAPGVDAGLADQTAMEGTAFSYTVPSNAFDDLDDVSLTLTASGQPDWLVFNPSTGAFAGTPGNGDVGGIVTVTATDASGASVSTSFALDIDGVNDPATLGDDYATTTEGNTVTLTTAMLLGNDYDPDTALSITAVSVPPLQGTVSAISGGTFTFAPDAAFNGVAEITYTTNTGDTATVFVTVTPDNDAPAGNVSGSLTVAEGDPSGAEVADVDATDADGDTPTFTLVSGNDSGLFTIDANGVVTTTRVADDAEVGGHHLEVLVEDGNGGSDTVQFTVQVTNVNDAPVAAIATLNANATEDDAFVLTLPAGAFSDADGDALTYTIDAAALAAGVSVDANTGTLSWTPDQADVDAGPLTVTVTATDPSSATATLDVVITPVNVNDAPTTTGIADLSATEDSPFTLDVTSAFTDLDPGDTLTLSASGQPDWLVFDPSTGMFSGTPAEGDVGGTITVQATDISGASVDATFTLAVTPFNDAAVAVDDSRTTREDIPPFAQTIQGTVLANDSDEEGDFFEVTHVEGAAANLATAIAGDYGTLYMFADGSYYYQLDNDTDGLPGPVQELTEGQVEQDTFTYTITGGATADLIINVIGTADAPVISEVVGDGDTASGSVIESFGNIDTLDQPLTAAGTLTLTDVDLLDTVDVAVNSVALNGATSVGYGADTGVVTLAELLPMLTITPANPILDNTENQDQFNWNFNSGTEGFDFLNAGDSLVIDYTLIATDSEGVDSDPQVVTITITGTNDRPTVDLSTADMGSADYAATFTETGATIAGSGPVNIADATGVSIADPDDPLDAEAGNITMLTVSFTALDAGSEQLILSGALPGTISVNGASTATNLILDGTGASLADFEAALQLIQYVHTADNPTTGDRSITVTVTDVDGDTSVPATSTITVVDSNDTPDISNDSGDAVSYTENAAPVTLDANANVAISDPDTISSPDGIGDYDGASLTASITSGGVSTEDVLSVGNVGLVTVAGSDISFGGFVVATFTGGSGGAPLVITYTADANTTAVNAVAQALQYANSAGNTGGPGDDPTVGEREITLTYNDGGNIGGGAAQPDATVAGELITVSVALDLTQPVHVMDGATAVGTFNTIQEAIDAIGVATYGPGINTIHVEPAGSDAYAANEAIEIDVPVTIIGDPAGGDRSEVTLSGVTIFDSALESGTDAVSLSNLTITSVGTSPANGIAILDDDADADGSVSISNVSVSGFQGPGLSTSTGSTGVLTTVSVTLNDVDFSENGLNGDAGSNSINLFNFAGNATLTDVTVDNTASAQYGIQIAGWTGQDAAASGNIPGAIGSVVFDGVTVTGDYAKSLVFINGYNNLAGLDFTGGLNLGDGVTPTDSGWAGLFINPDSTGGTFTPFGGATSLDLTGVTAGAGAVFGTNGAPWTAAPVVAYGSPVDPDTMTGSAEDDVLIGLGGDDTLDGVAGNDLYVLNVDGSVDTVTDTGGDAGDVALVFGTTGDDSLEVVLDGTGNVTNIEGGAITNVELFGGDLGTEGTGGDTLDYTGSASAVTVDLSSDTATGFALGISEVENVVGTDYDDTLTGSSENNTLTGGAGADTFTGSAGTDTIHGGTATTDNAAPTVDSATFTAGTLAYDAINGVWTVTDGGNVTTLTGIEEVTIGATTYHLVDQDANGGYETIQEAIDAAADGDTVMVGDGTYVEQIEIDGRSNLTISAANADTVTVEAPATLVQTSTSSSGRDTFSIIDVDGSTNIVINDIDVDGNGTTAGLSGTNPNNVGINFRNSSGSLTEVDITGIHDPYPGGTTLDGYPTVSGNQRGVGLQVDNDSLMSFAMTGGSISDFQKNATVFNFADLNVTGVEITGGGAQQIIAQNGIQALNSTGVISNNVINDIGYAGPSLAYSGGVLAYGNVDLDITNNVVTGTNDATTDSKVVGIYVFDFGTPNSGGSITGNTVTLTDVGIGVYGDIQPDAIAINNNTISNLDTLDPFYAGVDFEPNAGLAVPFDVEGSAEDDILLGSDANDTLTGLGGDDYIAGNLGDDTIVAGEGDDFIDYLVGDGVPGDGNDRVDGGAEGPNGDVLNIDNAASTTATTFTIGQITGATEIEPTTGGDAIDILVNIDTTASMSISGVLGSIRMDAIEDIIITLGTGGDTVTVTTSLGGTSLSFATIEIIGGTGDDIANIGEIDATLPVGVDFDGDAGIDTVSFAGANTGATVNLGAGTATSDGASHSLTNVENVIGSDNNDEITGSDQANIITGGAGNDTISGGDGIDTAVLSGNSTDYMFLVDPGTGVITLSGGPDGTDTIFPDVENIEFDNITVDLTDAVRVVSSTGALVDTYDTIQAAIDAGTTLDGMTIQILGQTTAFAEALSVDKALSFVGVDVGHGQPVITVSSGNAVTIDGLTTVGDVSFDGVNLLGTGTASYGVNLRPGADVGTFSFTNAEVSGFGYAGIYSSNNGSNVSDTVDVITIDTVEFSDNGTNNQNGSGNIKLFGFAGDATIQNVTIEGGTYVPPSFSGLPEYAIEITGDIVSELGAGNAAGAPPIGTVLLNNIDVTGDFEKNLVGIFNFEDLDNLTITDLDLSGGDSVDWQVWFNIDGIAATTIDASGYGIIFPSGSQIFAEIQGEKSGQGIVDSNITGTAVGDSIHGKGGNDTLFGLAGDDRLYGSNKNGDVETGNDIMEGGAGDDYLDGDGNTTGDIAVFRGSVGDAITYANITSVISGTDPNNGSPFDGWQVDATGLTTNQGTDTLNEVEIIETRDGADALVSRILLVGDGGFATIQAAVDEAASGDTIMIAAGDYSGEGSIVVADKVLTFAGALHGTSPVTDAASWSDPADQSIIDRFQVTGTGGITLDGVHLLGQNQPTGGDPYSAVQMLGTGGITVVNSIVSTDQTATAGVSIATAIEVGYVSTDVTIENVAFTGFIGEAGDYAFGVYVNYNPSVTHNVSITNSLFDVTSNGGTAGIIGLPVATDGRQDSSGTFTVTDNTFANTNGGYALAHRDFVGVITSATDFSGVQGNTFVDADYTFGGPEFESGVVRNGSDFAVVTGGPNTIDGVTYAQIITGVGQPDTAASINDMLTGGAGADYIRGINGNDVIDGGDGDDNIDGNAGDDTITGGLGDDIIAGSESGETTGDTAVYAEVLSVGDITYSAGSWTVTTATEGTDTLTGIEVVQGVDPDAGGPATGRFLLVDTDAVGGFATIQAAVDAANSGDTILIAPGTYDGNISITVPDLSIVAVGNPGDVVVSGPLMSLIGVTPLNDYFEANHPAYSGATGFDVSADGVSVTGITFQGFSEAISLGSSTGVEITGNTFVNNVTGLRKGTEADVQTITISDNEFSQGIHGMTIYAASNGNGAFDGVTMSNNTFMAMSEKGMYFEQLSNAILDGNTFDDVGNYGRVSPPFGSTDGEFGQAIDINLKYETYENVTFSNTGITDSGNSDQDGAGSPGAFGAAIGIKIRDDAPSYNSAPADFTGQITFDGLTIDGTSTGVRVGEPGKDNQGPDVLLNNVTISNATESDVDNATDTSLGGTVTVVLSATQTDLDASASQAPVNVTGNAAANIIDGGSGDDTITGGDGADTISGGDGVDTAVYTEAYSAVTGLTWDGTTASVTIGGVTDTITGVGKLEFSDRTVWLVDDTVGGDYTTLAELFDGSGDEAVDGDIILLGEGTYSGTVNIDQSVAIYGPNIGLAGDEVGRVGEAVIQNGQLRIEADGVVIDGIAFANGALNLMQFAAVQVRGENVTIQNSVFERSDGFGGARGVITEQGFALGLALTANSFSGWATGVYLNPDSTASVSDNVFDGNNVGMSIDGPDAASVENNTFANSTAEHVGVGAINDLSDASFVAANNTFDASAPEVSIYPLAGGTGGQVIIGSANDDLFNGDMTNTTLGQVFDGGAGDDIINMGGGNDTAIDGAGVDIVNLGDGDDTMILSVDNADDTIIGGSGIDTVDLSAIATAVNVNLSGATPNATGAAIGTNSLSGFESVIGGLGGDSITGSNGANTLVGGAGADTITGLDGADIIDGGSGDAANDSLRGFANAPGVGDALEDRFLFSGLFGTDTVTDFENDFDKLDINVAVPGDATLNIGSDDGTSTVNAVTSGADVHLIVRDSDSEGTIVLQNFDIGDVNGADFDFT